MLISVVVGWHFLTGAIRQGSLIKTAVISVGVGLFWTAWAPFQWRETPPVIVPVWTFVAHAVVTGTLLAVACGILSGRAWDQYKPGWFGLGLSALILAVFYSEQVKRLGLRPLIVLPLLVGSVLALLRWTQEKTEQPEDCVRSPDRWKCAATTLVIPLIASLGYAFQRFSNVRGIPPSWIFNGLALIGGVFFLAVCGSVIRKRMAPALGRGS